MSLVRSTAKESIILNIAILTLRILLRKMQKNILGFLIDLSEMH
jgi:hypothetical protein